MSVELSTPTYLVTALVVLVGMGIAGWSGGYIQHVLDPSTRRIIKGLTGIAGGLAIMGVGMFSVAPTVLEGKTQDIASIEEAYGVDLSRTDVRKEEPRITQGDQNKVFIATPGKSDFQEGVISLKGKQASLFIYEGDTLVPVTT